MLGLDKEPIRLMCREETGELSKSSHTITAKQVVAKAKSVVSPYFGAKDFAFAYVLS